MDGFMLWSKAAHAAYVGVDSDVPSTVANSSGWEPHIAGMFTPGADSGDDSVVENEAS